MELDLTALWSYEFHASTIRDGIIKNGMLYGQNDSGKTNFSLALADIVIHLSDNFNAPDTLPDFAYGVK